jgi:hypothetical protein
VWLEGNRYMHGDPSTNWCGGMDVTIRTINPDGLWDEEAFRVAVSLSWSGPVEMPGHAKPAHTCGSSSIQVLAC